MNLLKLLALTWFGVCSGLLIPSIFGAAASADVPVEVGGGGSWDGFGPITTFSIVAYDPETGDYGIGVQSKYFAVGDVVPFAEANIGALATQARGNILHGPAGLKLLSQGMSSREVIQRLIEQDPESDSRQLGVVDTNGKPATYTGIKCLPWAGGVSCTSWTIR